MAMFVLPPGQKPFQCGLCSEAFTLNADLVIHVDSHQLTKPYQCGYCKVSYHTNDPLTVHVRAHKLMVCMKKDKVIVLYNRVDDVHSMQRDCRVETNHEFSILGGSERGELRGVACEGDKASGNWQPENDGLDRGKETHITECSQLENRELEGEHAVSSDLQSLMAERNMCKETLPDRNNVKKRKLETPSCSSASKLQKLSIDGQDRTISPCDSSEVCPLDTTVEDVSVNPLPNNGLMFGHETLPTQDISHKAGIDQATPSESSCTEDCVNVKNSPGLKETVENSASMQNSTECSTSQQNSIENRLSLQNTTKKSPILQSIAEGIPRQQNTRWKSSSLQKTTENTPSLQTITEKSHSLQITTEKSHRLQTTGKSPNLHNTTKKSRRLQTTEKSPNLHNTTEKSHRLQTTGKSPNLQNTTEKSHKLQTTGKSPNLQNTTEKSHRLQTTEKSPNLQNTTEKSHRLQTTGKSPNLHNTTERNRRLQTTGKSPNLHNTTERNRRLQTTGKSPNLHNTTKKSRRLQTTGKSPNLHNTTEKSHRLQTTGKSPNLHNTTKKSRRLQTTGKSPNLHNTSVDTDLMFHPFLCSLCGQSFSEAKLVGQHFRSVHRKDNHQVELCPSADIQCSCPLHSTGTDGDSKDTLNKGPGRVKSFQCYVCTKQFMCRCHGNHHILKKHTFEKLRPYECAVCGFRFKWVQVLKDHFDARHGNGSRKYCISKKNARHLKTQVVLKTTEECVHGEESKDSADQGKKGGQHKTSQNQLWVNHLKRRYNTCRSNGTQRSRQKEMYARQLKTQGMFKKTEDYVNGEKSKNTADKIYGQHETGKNIDSQNTVYQVEKYKQNESAQREESQSTVYQAEKDGQNKSGQTQDSQQTACVDKVGKDGQPKSGQTENTACRPFLCSLCGQSFPEALMVGQHFRSVHRKGKQVELGLSADTQCPCPLHGTATDGLLMEALSKDKFAFKCSMCDAVFKCRYDCNLHIFETHGIQELRAFECGVCRFRFKLVHHLRNHYKTCHNGDTQRQRPQLKEISEGHLKSHGVLKKTVECVNLERSQDTAEQAVKGRQHSTGQTEDSAIRPFLCSLCGDRFTKAVLLSQHFRSVHTNEKPMAELCLSDDTQCPCPLHSTAAEAGSKETCSNGQAFECRVCNALFMCRYEYNLHTSKTHSTESLRLFECGVCRLRFKLVNHLKHHYNARHGNGTQRFQQKQMNTKQLKTYGMFKKTEDSVNGEKSKNTADQAKKHEQLKTGQTENLAFRPFLCSLCGQSFSEAMFVGQHFRSVHKKGRRVVELFPFADTHCFCPLHSTGTDRDSKDTLNKGPGRMKSFQCYVCAKQFTCRYHGNHHIIKRHTFEKPRPYECAVCGLRFKWVHHLRDHFDARHGNGTRRFLQKKNARLNIQGLLKTTEDCVNGEKSKNSTDQAQKDRQHKTDQTEVCQNSADQAKKHGQRKAGRTTFIMPLAKP